MRGLDPVPRRVPTSFSAINRALLLGFSPETFARRIKATLFTARQATRFRAVKREEGGEFRERAKGTAGVSLSRINFPRNKIAVRNSQVNLNCACRKGRKTARAAGRARRGQILNIDRDCACLFVRRRQKRAYARCIPLGSKILWRYKLRGNSRATRISAEWYES